MLTIHPVSAPVQARITVPGSKSITNRALVVAALCRSGVSRLYHPLEADDTRAMREALRTVGVLIDDNDDPWLVLGAAGDLQPPASVIDVGASGTTARFVTALAALVPGLTRIDGVERMRERPIGPLVDALQHLGVNAQSVGGYPPVTVEGVGAIAGGSVSIDSRASSQFASALLMVAPMATSAMEILLQGPVVSRPYLDGTVEVMRAFGAEVEVDGDRFVVQPTGYEKAHLEVEPDASAAVYPAVAAAITNGEVQLPGFPPGSLQPDLAVFDVLEQMGCLVERGEDGIAISGPPDGVLKPVVADMSGAPDGSMAIAVAALFADGESRITGLSTLRLKETDRLAALQTELNRVGGQVEVVDDELRVRPGALHGARISTYGDHRMAMAMALVGLRVEGVEILNPEVVTKTWPGYFDMLERL